MRSLYNNIITIIARLNTIVVGNSSILAFVIGCVII